MIRPRLVAVACAGGLACTPLQPAVALPVPTDPKSPAVAEAWANPAVRPTDGLRGELLLVDAPLALPASQSPSMFHVKLRISNHSESPLEGMRITPRRAPATGSVSDQRVAAVAQVGEYTVLGPAFEVPGTLKPGESRDVEFDAELPMEWLGAYPVMLQLTDADGTTLDTERFHLSVRGAPTTDPNTDLAPGSLTALYPISAPVDILPGETGEAPEEPPLVLASEQLASQLAPGGRLDALADALLEAAADPATGSDVNTAVCAALDPALIDTVDRMSRGYTVSATRAPVVEEPKRLRDSWGSSDDAPLGETGTGAHDASVWLAKLRRISQNGCTVALPWANTDINAVARTGDPWLMREALERGPFTLAKVLGNTGVTNTVIAPSGYVAANVAPSLGWADHTRSTIPEEGMSGSWERALAAATGGQGPSAESALERDLAAAPDWAAAPEPVAPVHVLTAGADAGAPGGARGAWLAPGVGEVHYSAALNATLAQIGQAPSTMAYTNPALRFDYTKDSKRARDINAAAAMQLAARSAMAPVPQHSDGPGAGDSAAASADGAAPQPPATGTVLLNPPALWDADSAAALLGTIAYLTSEGYSRPEGLEDLLERVDAMPAPPEPPPAVEDDPTAYSEAEILTATQQTRFINDLSTLLAPDNSIALTRYGFTLPLRRDVLNAFAPAGRRTMGSYSAAAAETSKRLSGSREELSALQGAVTLIPPGNVYTRTSPTSPLLIVARNGMPLPVEATIGYVAESGTRLNVPETFRIPARGSVTVTMTADLPQDATDTSLQLYLAGRQGQAFSTPVDIAVRTPSLALRGWVLVLGGLALTALFALVAAGAKRRRKGLAPPSAHTASASRKPRRPSTANRTPRSPEKPNGAPS